MSTHNHTKKYFNYLDGKQCSCPYCQAKFIWPPEQLCCPECKRTIRPPIGYVATKEPENKKTIMKRIAREHDLQMRKLGQSNNIRIKNNPKILFCIIFVFFILGGLMFSQASSAKNSKIQRTKADLTKQDLNVLAQALVHYKIDVGNYPMNDINDEGLNALISIPPGSKNWNGPYINKKLNDGWDRPYFYEVRNGQPRLISSGPDKIKDTEDDLVIDDFSKIQPHPDFVPFDQINNKRPFSSSRLRVKIAN